METQESEVKEKGRNEAIKMKAQVSLSLDEKVWSWVVEKARTLGMSRSGFINMFLTVVKNDNNILDTLITNWVENKRRNMVRLLKC